MNKIDHQNAWKIKMDALKWSAWNKLMENIYVLIKFWSKKCIVQKAHSDQNATEKWVKKIKRAC